MYIFNVPDKILIETAISFIKPASKRHFLDMLKLSLSFSSIKKPIILLLLHLIRKLPVKYSFNLPTDSSLHLEFYLGVDKEDAD